MALSWTDFWDKWLRIPQSYLAPEEDTSIFGATLEDMVFEDPPKRSELEVGNIFLQFIPLYNTITPNAVVRDFFREQPMAAPLGRFRDTKRRSWWDKLISKLKQKMTQIFLGLRLMICNLKNLLIRWVMK